MEDNGHLRDQLNSLHIASLDNEDDKQQLDGMDYEGQNDLDEVSSSEDDEEPVIIGFVEKPKNPSSLRRQNFPSKAGGVPAWMDPVNLPTGSSFVCDICEEPLQFLLQAYAPIENENTFHRTLFVFMCRSMKCLTQHRDEQVNDKLERPFRSVKVLRCQLPRQNPFYPSDNNGTVSIPGSEAHLCAWCGTWRGDRVCGACRGVRYCSRKHQAMHWHSGHKESCLLAPGSSHKVVSNTLWPELEIIIDDESEYDKDASDGDTNDSSLISKIKMDNHMDSVITNSVDDADKKHLASFQQRLTKAPEQVLRYYRNTTSRPLWPVSSGRLPNLTVLNCKYCGGPMCCEFQILPQLLYYLGVDNEKDSLDWATIVVHTCEASCDANVAYKEEFAWVQLYS